MLKTEARLAIFALAAVVAIRFLSLGFFGLSDPSEGRFASVSLHMLHSGDWLIPKINYGKGWEDYLAKPPLHIWLTALSFKLFGANETAARLPGFLSYILTGLLVYLIGRRVSPAVGLGAALLYLSVLGGFFIGASATTDPLLTLLYTASVFFLRSSDGSPFRRALFPLLGFSCLGLSVLTKGPLVPVLAAFGFVIYLVLSRDLSPLRTRLAFRSAAFLLFGAAIILLIAAPWYLTVEGLRPGFLRYYLFEENLNRYLSSSASVRYGSLKRYPYGSILLFSLLASFPWIVYFRGAAANLKTLSGSERAPLRFFMAFALSPILFFAFARNILPTYALPGLPWLCLLLALGLKSETFSRLTRLSVTASVMYAAILFYAGYARHVTFSGKNIASDLEERLLESGSGPVKFFSGPTNSLRFYMDAGYFSKVFSELPIAKTPGELIFAEKLDWPKVPEGYEELKRYKKWKVFRWGR